MFHLRSPSPEASSNASYEAALVRRFNSGDESAFTEIMERYHSHILALARRCLDNEHDAEDIAQDTFIRAHRGLNNFRGDSSLSTWLCRIAVNLARNRYWYFFRRGRHVTVSLNQPVAENQTLPLVEVVPADDPTPPRMAMQNEFVSLISNCLDQLEAQHRDILRRRYILHESYEEIGRSLNINIGTVKSRIARSREKLRRLVHHAAPEFGHHCSLADFFESSRDYALPSPAA
ncbi:MAG TPA: sigma-70 family RNA polymerase sigma factor [Lacunisphaera sp.]|jgi:RNA polymerase sigma-70 factor (ECF subfamily)|nr:sigma-70 family RNA polymerase sigma factor [Lacunisphaera sp.]